MAIELASVMEARESVLKLESATLNRHLPVLMDAAANLNTAYWLLVLAEGRDGPRDALVRNAAAALRRAHLAAKGAADGMAELAQATEALVQGMGGEDGGR